MAKTNKSPMNMIMIITLVVIALITALVIITSSGAESGTDYETAPPIEGQPIIGEEDAPVSIVEFGDFKCPACKQWGEEIYPQLIADYVESGEATFSFTNVLFHQEESYLASLAAESVYAQNPEVYWEFHKAVFEAQPAAHDSAWVTVENLVEIASSIEGIDTEQLHSDIENETYAAQVNEDSALVEEYDVELTPTIMVNNVMVEDPFDYEAISNLIDEELEGN